MKFENTQVFNFEGALRGMRNPMASWAKSDSHTDDKGNFIVGENDIALAQKLIKGGSEHRKFLRQIFVSVDITAPLYWFSEFDTYKVGTVANSTSKMHKIASTPITKDCFEIDDYNNHLLDAEAKDGAKFPEPLLAIEGALIPCLEQLRIAFNKTKDKRYWKELIRWLPESWLQTRTVTMNYENVLAICKQRKAHKLNEWSGLDNPNAPNFIGWAHTLPYAKEFIFLEEDKAQ